MAMPHGQSLLGYLSQPNVELDPSQLDTGPNTLSVRNYEVEGLTTWTDFTSKTS